MNLSMIVSWQSVGLTILATVALFGWRNLTPIMRDVALSCGLTFVFYMFFNLDQGQGFGYRYIYGILSNLALLAAVGLEQLTLSIKPARLLRWVALSRCLALGVQVPIRCWQTERFVRPFANSLAYIRSLKEPFVLLDPWTVWFAKDLVRNNPFLQTGPKVFFASRMTPELLQNSRQGRSSPASTGRVDAVWNASSAVSGAGDLSLTRSHGRISKLTDVSACDYGLKPFADSPCRAGWVPPVISSNGSQLFHVDRSYEVRGNFGMNRSLPVSGDIPK